MLVPISWLKEFVEIKEDIREVTDRLTMSGSNVEGVQTYGEDIKNVVIGQLTKVEKHPNADKLLITEITTGSEVYPIVTGATNIKAGDKVPVALPGATIFGGKKIRASKLRGEESKGMLCSARELGLDDHGLPEEVKNGIFILPADAPLGEDIKDYIDLEDSVVDFEITPNRSDCLSILGMAKEAAATFNRELKIPKIVLKEEAKESTENMVKVHIDAEDLCKRYVARIVEDVVIEPSPLWMQRRLQYCGVRPINNIVDITNYVMMELGQPLHAFDYDKIEGHSIIVRRSKASEKLMTLDGVKRELSEEMLVIADEKNPIALAGVMGGLESEIGSKTRRILLESANFNGPSIRRTSRKLGLRSESSMRFEKGIDPNLCSKAIDRACELIEKLGAGKVLKGSVDVFPQKTEIREVSFTPERINRVLGINISSDEILDILERLEISVESVGDTMVASIPTFRLDISKEADLVEEVGRMYGYDRLPITLPSGDVTHGKLNNYQKNVNDIKDTLVYKGFSEIYTYSFISPKAFERIKVPEDSSLRHAVSLMNPLGEEHSIMRTTLLPSMLNTIGFNLNRKVGELKLFEVSAVYLPKELPLKEQPYENKRLSLGLCDKSKDFYDLKGIIETIFMKLKIKDYVFKQDTHFAFHPGRCARIFLDDVEIGVAGEIHPDILEEYEIDQRVYVAELDIDKIADKAINTITFNPLPKFPASSRDLAIVVKDSVLAGDILDTIKEGGKKLLEEVELFDIYKGGQIPSGYKSMAFSLSFRAEDRTLTDEEINKSFDRITDLLKEKHEATLRE